MPEILSKSSHDVASEVPTSIPLWADRYYVIRELGRGGQGVVYLADDIVKQRRVALKVLSRRAITDAVCRGRFEREAQVTARIDHPGICTVYDSGVVGDIPYIAMKYVEGETLAARIRRAKDGDDTVRVTPSSITPSSRLTDAGAFSEGSSHAAKTRPRAPSTRGRRPASLPSTRESIHDAIRLIEDAARALHVAHNAGFVHRDIKPGNILVANDGQPVILDFGLASDTNEDAATLTATGEMFGTPAYMSPEQVRGETSRLDRRTDVWSLGVTLYEFVTLARPFNAPTREGLVKAIQVTEPQAAHKVNAAVPRELSLVIATALEKDTWRRYQSAADFADELQRVREGRAILAQPAGPLVRGRRWAARNPAVAVGLSFLFIFLTISLHLTTHLLKGAELKALEATCARTSAEAEQRRTEATLRRNQDVLDRLVTRAAASTESGTESDAQAQLTLDSAAALYRGYIHEHGGNPAMQSDVAGAHYRLARIHLALGQSELAIAHGRSAISACQYAIRGALVKTDLTRLLVSACEVVARGHMAAKSYDHAEEFLRRAHAVAEVLVSENPHDREDVLRLEGLTRDLSLVTKTR